ncbi:MAG: MlaD family protein, partial [Psychromonas sp.]
ENKHFVVSATINPQFSELVTEGAQFWLEKTSITFSKIKNLGNIITGDYLAFEPVSDEQMKTSKSSTRFVIQESHTSLNPGISLMVVTDDATGLNPGDPINYNGIKIGSINSLGFSENSQFIETRITINHNYKYLINDYSQFYLLSGINFKASLQGLEVQSTPMENIISGGIGLYNKVPVKKSDKVTPIDKDQRFRLYPSKNFAKVGKNIFSKPLTISLLSKQLPSVSVGSPVYYQKLPIGEVSGFNLDDSGLMKTKLSIKGQYKHLISKQSVFWNVSGFEVDAGLSGVKVQAESLLAIASGGIAVGFAEKEIENMHRNGAYKLFDNRDQATQPATRITLTFNQANDLQTGSKLRLKGLVIGEIKTLELNSKNKVQATIAIKPEFAKKVARKGSRFWMIRSDISLSGAKNLSTLITGVYINVSLGKGEVTKRFVGEDTEPLLAAHKTGLPIILLADNAGSTDVSSPVYYRQIQIGEVIAKQLTNDAAGVEIVTNIYPQYSHLIRENSIFWPASGFNLNVGITGATLKSTSLTSLIKGGINMSTPDNKSLQPMSDAFSRFQLKTEFNEHWLTWKLSIPKP